MKNSPADLLNRLEAFAMFFVAGVAAESPAFLTVGCLYCDIVKEMFPFIASLSDDEPSDEHLKSLYARWHNRREKMHLIREKTKIDIKLNKYKKSSTPPVVD